MVYNTILRSNNTNLQTIFNTINTLPEANAVKLPTLNNPGTANDLLLNKQLINDKGGIVNGIFTIDDELAAQNDIVVRLQDVIDSLPNANTGMTGTCSLTINSPNAIINQIYYSSNNNYINTSSSVLPNVDIRKPILIDFHHDYDGPYSIESTVFEVESLAYSSNPEILIIQCLSPDINASINFNCLDIG